MPDDIKKIKDTPKKKREFGVILESIESKVQHIVEAVDDHTKRLGRVEHRGEARQRCGASERRRGRDQGNSGRYRI